MHFIANNYGPLLGRVVDTSRRRALDAGNADAGIHDALVGLTVDAAFAHAPVASRDMALCCIAAAWLLHDYLDESHAISQNIHEANGSYWHGIMHRREGDYSNAKYWFGHVGSHPIHAKLAAAARDLAAPDGSAAARTLANWNDWDAHKFVDLCRAAAAGEKAGKPLLECIQQAEWELLFDHCYALAIGRT